MENEIITDYTEYSEQSIQTDIEPVEIEQALIEDEAELEAVTTAVSVSSFSYADSLQHIENNTSGILLVTVGIALILICTVISNTFKSFL